MKSHQVRVLKSTLHALVLSVPRKWPSRACRRVRRVWHGEQAETRALAGLRDDMACMSACTSTCRRGLTGVRARWPSHTVTMRSEPVTRTRARIAPHVLCS